jgi:hypothetical protein
MALRSSSWYFIGWTGTPQAAHLIGTPKAPRNYGPEAAREYARKRREQLLEGSDRLPIVSTLTEVVVLDETGELVAGFPERDNLRVSVRPASQFLDWLGQLRCDSSLVGFDLQHLVDMVVADRVLRCTADDAANVPYWILTPLEDNVFKIHDLHDSVFYRHVCEQELVNRALWGQPPWPEQAPARRQAEMALDLVRRLGLVRIVEAAA